MNHYAQAGVNVSEADKAIERITQNIKSTWPDGGLGEVKLDIGYFANVIDIGGKGLAIATDGVGSKTMIADMMDDYSTIGIDCVAMNVNDLICVGAKPISMVDYIGVELADASRLGEISEGLTVGAKQAGISISGGEISQLPDTIKGFDLVGTAFGLVDLNKILVGEEVEPGDAIIGIASTGIHSNGFTLARRVLFDNAKLDPNGDYGFDHCLGNELLIPTAIYVQEILDLLDGLPIKALINITGDGLLNLNRVKAQGVGFHIDRLMDIPKIFGMIQEYGQVDDATMFQTFNMGIGFCVVVDRGYKQDVINIVHSYDRDASDIGLVVTDQYKTVFLPQRSLIGRGKSFSRM